MSSNQETPRLEAGRKVAVDNFCNQLRSSATAIDGLEVFVRSVVSQELRQRALNLSKALVYLAREIEMETNPERDDHG